MTEVSGLERFATVELVVVGSMNVDQIIYCQRFPADGETLVAERYVQGFGGKGANQAVMAARLGARVTMIGCLGDDDLGDATIANLEAMSVDADGSHPRGGRIERSRPDLGRRHGHQPHPDRPRRQRRPRPRQVTDVLEGADDPTPSSPNSRRRRRRPPSAFASARRAGALTVFNPAPAAPVEPDVLAHVDWLVANESEFTLLFGSDPTGKAVAAAADEWRCGVVVTLGAAGALVAATTEPAASVPAPAVTAVDTTGAGDAFVGTFAVGLAAGLTPHEAARLGCVSGALSVQRHGTQPSFPTPAELETAAFGT